MSHPVINHFNNVHASCTIVHEDNKNVIVRGIIADNIKTKEVEYFAAAPPDFRASFTGSGLPFANESMAFHNTPNAGKCSIGDNGSFIIKITLPNSYYAGLGTVIIPPVLYLKYETASGTPVIFGVPVSKGIPYRMLTYPMQFTKARKDVSFYDGGWDLPVRTQEQIFLSSTYPSVNSMDPTFWGLRPRQ